VPSFYHKHEHLTIKSQVKKRILKNEKRRTTGATIPPIICRKYLNPETTHRFSTHWVEISGPVICSLFSTHWVEISDSVICHLFSTHWVEISGPVICCLFSTHWVEIYQHHFRGLSGDSACKLKPFYTHFNSSQIL